MTLIYSIIIISVLGLLLGLALALANKYLYVAPDEKLAEVTALMPGANCGGCGYPGCAQLAKAIVEGKEKPSKCPVATAEARARIAAAAGGDAGENVVQRKAFVSCMGGTNCKNQSLYQGMEDCRAAAASGIKGCTYGCIGLLSCTKACPVGAITKRENGVPAVDWEKCISCGVCVATCPKNLIELLPVTAPVKVACSNREFGKKPKEICASACIGCGICAKVCESKAITMDRFLPIIDYDKCIGCGKCAERCPQKVIKT